MIMNLPNHHPNFYTKDLVLEVQLRLKFRNWDSQKKKNSISVVVVSIGSSVSPSQQKVSFENTKNVVF